MEDSLMTIYSFESSSVTWQEILQEWRVWELYQMEDICTAEEVWAERAYQEVLDDFEMGQ
jgi:hypothetical protein